MDDKIIPLGSFVPYFRSLDNDFFSMQIGGTVYEVTTHFNTLHGILALPCNARLSERRLKN